LQKVKNIEQENLVFRAIGDWRKQFIYYGKGPPWILQFLNMEKGILRLVR
jgi:hypothetical protein